MGLNGLEPSTSSLSGVRSNQLSYRYYNIKRVTKSTRDNNEGCSLPLNYTRI